MEPVVVQDQETRVSNEIRPHEAMSRSVGNLVDCEVVRVLHVLPHEVVRGGDVERAVTGRNWGPVGEHIHRVMAGDTRDELEVAKRRTVCPWRKGGEPGDSLQRWTLV